MNDVQAYLLDFGADSEYEMSTDYTKDLVVQLLEPLFLLKE